MSVSQRGAKWEVNINLQRTKGEGARWRLSCVTEAAAKRVEAAILADLAADRVPDMDVMRELARGPEATQTLREVAALAVSLDASRGGWGGSRGVRTAEFNAATVCRILGGNRPVRTITAEDVDTLIERLEEEGSSDATINRKCSAFRVLLRIAERRGWIDRIPPIPHRKESKGRIRFLQPGEEERLLSTALHLGYALEADYWTFLLDTGCRAREGLGITWSDVNRDHATGEPVSVTFWHTKNDEPRTVPLTRRLGAILDRRQNLPRPFDKLDYDTARHHWDRVKNVLGFTEDNQWLMHMLRHTCASRLVQRGIPLMVVQQWLGHKSIEMTMRYAHLCPQNLEAARDALERPRVALVAETVDALALEASSEGSAGSNPVRRTNTLKAG